MKRQSIYIIFSILSVIFLAGCSKSGSQLIGAWSSYDTSNYGQQRCEFFKDGSCFLEQGQRLSGTWSAFDNGRLKVIVTMGGGRGIVILANVSGDELFLDEGGNRRMAYVREGSPKASEIHKRTDKRFQATETLNDARIIDGAIDQFAIENDKKGNDSVRSADIAKCFKPGSRLHTQAVSGGELTDVLGNKFIYSTFDSGVHVNPASKADFKDVIENEASFWGAY